MKKINRFTLIAVVLTLFSCEKQQDTWVNNKGNHLNSKSLGFNSPLLNEMYEGGVAIGYNSTNDNGVIWSIDPQTGRRNSDTYIEPKLVMDLGQFGSIEQDIYAAGIGITPEGKIYLGGTNEFDPSTQRVYVSANTTINPTLPRTIKELERIIELTSNNNGTFAVDAIIQDADEEIIDIETYTYDYRTSTEAYASSNFTLNDVFVLTKNKNNGEYKIYSYRSGSTVGTVKTATYANVNLTNSIGQLIQMYKIAIRANKLYILNSYGGSVYTCDIIPNSPLSTEPASLNQPSFLTNVSLPGRTGGNCFGNRFYTLNMCISDNLYCRPGEIVPASAAYINYELNYCMPNDNWFKASNNFSSVTGVSSTDVFNYIRDLSATNTFWFLN